MVMIPPQCGELRAEFCVQLGQAEVFFEQCGTNNLKSFKVVSTPGFEEFAVLLLCQTRWKDNHFTPFHQGNSIEAGCFFRTWPKQAVAKKNENWWSRPQGSGTGCGALRDRTGAGAGAFVSGCFHTGHAL